MELDRDAPLLLQVHVVQDLVELHLACRDGTGPLQQPVRDRGLPVIDVGNDAEISDMISWMLYEQKIRPAERDGLVR